MEILVLLALASLFALGLYAGRYIWPYQAPVKGRPVLGVLTEGRVACVLMDESGDVELSHMTVAKSQATPVLLRGRGRGKQDRFERVGEHEGVLVYRRTAMVSQ